MAAATAVAQDHGDNDPKLLEKVSLERPDDLLETAEKDGIL